MNWVRSIAILLVVKTAALAQETATPQIGEFANVTRGHYQVLCEDGAGLGWEVNQFMNQMLAQYSRYFSNWQAKDAARVVVFSNRDQFRAYSAGEVGLTHSGLAGYCHLKTDEDGNTFYELVTYVHDDLWTVLAHEGFHQFIGYEMSTRASGIPIWLNEGIAQFFETSYPVAGRLKTGVISPRKLRAAQYLIQTREAPSVRTLLEMDRATFYANARVSYPMSWALVYYLMTRDGSNYSSSRFHRYLIDLKFNQNAVGSFQRRFGRDSNQWQTDFERFILNLRIPKE